MVAKMIPYTEITEHCPFRLSLHVVSYYISSYYENLKYRGYLDELLLTSNIVSYLLTLQTFLVLQMEVFLSSRSSFMLPDFRCSLIRYKYCS